jgi:hypothetical protein
MNQMFDDQLLEEFVFGFYGHGNLEGKYWFIGSVTFDATAGASTQTDDRAEKTAFGPPLWHDE